MNILILTGKFGMGHFSAAQSIKEQIENDCEEVVVHIEDLFVYTLEELSAPLYKGFSLLVSHGEFIYNTYYNLTENAKKIDIEPLFHIFAPKFEKLLEEYKPDMIIATHPFCAQVVSQYKSINNISIPLITCITDISSHIEWLSDMTDYYLIGSDTLSEKLQEKGIDSDRIWVAGIPVRDVFKKENIKKNDNIRRLLIMGGGLGLMPTDKSFYKQLSCLTNTQTTIITGNNHKLYAKIFDKYQNINVLGYVDNIYDYMASADLILTKPGGITMSEAIFSELPIVAWAPSLQQEKNNAQFLINAGIGVQTERSPKSCLAVIERLLREPEEINNMKNCMVKMKQTLEKRNWTKHLYNIVSNSNKSCKMG